ncbi:pyruvate dehydrogenase (acetyl-transferring) E1 component subunit alpha [Glutamicibacter sp. PS]|uniref:pyruvate dehydrogenase (acetyl-transferring) E1 component subunit alpha n=1 Tax=Glutamicibacter sp. PS TaxID=3075634 RepID=UPI002843471C|nr:pyruvate dehydrogenase (acetyl-transferring) E1 component subunit alpha [Glutamicibacter sp. PS]MDR4533450.1 pyruvate dehydrogenase (acetyl-transferring) E1 component subunit alpha [Glutamicibacter sp. PS]
MPIVSTQRMDVDAEGLPTHQVLSTDGERIPDTELDHYLANLTPAMLSDFLRDMVVVRRMDAEANALQRQGQLGLWAPLLGQEAAQIGSIRAARNDDFIFPSYREHAVAWARGVKAQDLLSVWRGVTPSGWDPYQVNIACQQIVIGAQALHAVGYALGIKFDGSHQVAFGYFGDGATSQGDVNEAMVFAASYQAPVVFFCQNNQWAISEPVGLQSRTQIADRAHGFGLKVWRVDGNDVLAVYAATKAATEYVRHGLGPVFIEAVTYRMGAHTTADDPTRYRTEEQLDKWRAKDPIDRLRKYLEKMGADLPAMERRAEEAADQLAADLRAAITSMPDPGPEALFENVYAEPHPLIEAQRTGYLEYLATFEGQDA